MQHRIEDTNIDDIPNPEIQHSFLKMKGYKIDVQDDDGIEIPEPTIIRSPRAKRKNSQKKLRFDVTKKKLHFKLFFENKKKIFKKKKNVFFSKK